MDGFTKESHPSYATLAFSRRTGGAITLFGSSIKHSDTIAMTLYHADYQRSLHTDWIHGNKVIAEIEMSYSQFAEAITSMNNGSGIPVTLRFTEKDGRIPPCEFINKREQFTNEYMERIDRVYKKANQAVELAEELIQKKSLTKEDKNQLISLLNTVKSEVGTNSKFTVDMFNEQMDKTVQEAKGEIEAFCQNKINSIAQVALVENRELLLETKPVIIE